MDMRLSGSVTETKDLHWSNAWLPREVTPSGTTTWPFASGVYWQRAATPPSASRTKIVVTSISLVTASATEQGF